MRFSLFFLFAIAFSSCDYYAGAEEGFYAYNKDGDLWRVPLIEPYEVVSPTNSDMNDWFLVVEAGIIKTENYDVFGDEEQFTDIRNVAIQDSVIILDLEKHYWPLLSSDFDTKVVLDARNHELFAYPSVQDNDFEIKINDLGIETPRFYDWQSVKSSFLDSLGRPDGWPSY